jgi:hypothetical protein
MQSEASSAWGLVSEGCTAIRRDYPTAIATFQCALEVAQQQEREQIVTWVESLMPGQFVDVHELLAVLPGAIASLRHKETNHAE